MVNNVKIGIITFHRAHNFGAMLQAFALQRFLSKNYDVKIIDYRPIAIEREYYIQKGFKSFIKNQIKWIIRYKQQKYLKQKRKKFIKFENNYLEKTKDSYNETSIIKTNGLFDLFIAGSDQIWNIDITTSDLHFFLDFVDDDNKKITYAASFGKIGLIKNNSNKDYIISLLSKIKEPLLREDEGIDELKSLGVDTWKDAKIVCDPSFLMDKIEWNLMFNLEDNKEHYILLFLVAKPTNSIEFAHNLSIEKKLKVKFISTYGKVSDCPEWCENTMSSGPIEFLKLIYNADYIVTTSFHGMAFSINFRKQFFYELDRNEIGRNSRLTKLSTVFSLSDNEILDKQIDDINYIDYSAREHLIADLSRQSKKTIYDRINHAFSIIDKD